MFERRAVSPTCLVIRVLLVLLLAACVVSGARADADGARCRDRLDDAEVSERLLWLDARLDKGVAGAAVWWGGWLSYATAEGVFGFTKFARARDRLDRDLWLVTGVGAGLWVAQLGVFPMLPAYAPLRMRRLPRTTEAERLVALAASERLLREAAQAERDGLHWVEHALDLAWAFGSAAYILGRSHGRVRTARLLEETGVELAATVLLSEAAILSTPRQAIRDRARYEARSCGDGVQPRGREFASERHSWQLGVSPQGASLTVHF